MKLATLSNNFHPSVKFAMVGCTGFLIDITIFYLLYEVINLDLMLARILAFTVAATSNWFLNRLFTFSRKSLNSKKSEEWFKFLTSAAFSAIPNLATFYLLVNILPQSIINILVAMICGIAIGYYSNYRLANDWVFKHNIK